MKQHVSLPRHANGLTVKHLYRPYFRGGIAVALTLTLTLGAVWGAWLLAVWEAYAACALGWFAVQAVYGAVYFAALSGAQDRDAVLGLVSLWQAPPHNGALEAAGG